MSIYAIYTREGRAGNVVEQSEQLSLSVHFFRYLFLSVLLIIADPVHSGVDATEELREMFSSTCSSGLLSIDTQSTTEKWKVSIDRLVFSELLDLSKLRSAGADDRELISRMHSAGADTLILGANDIELDLEGRGLKLKNGVSVWGRGMSVYSSKPINSLISNAESGSRHEIVGLNLEGRGNVNYALIRFRATDGLLISENIFTGVSQSAVVVSSSRDRPARDVWLKDNYIHSPLAGVGHVILINSLPDGMLVECVVLSGNRLVGTDPLAPAIDDYTATNEYTGDQVTLQGVVGFLLYKNYSGWSGSSGFTISRLSSNGVIQENIAEMCFEPGFNIGSSYESINVDGGIGANISKLKAGRAEMVVKHVRALAEGEGTHLRGSVSKGVFSVGDTVKSESGAVLSIVRNVTRSVQDVVLEGNKSINTSIQRRRGKVLAAYNVIRSERVYLDSNEYMNSEGVGRANRFLSLSASTGFVDDASVREYGVKNIQVAGPTAKLNIVKGN